MKKQRQKNTYKRNDTKRAKLNYAPRIFYL